MGINVFLIPILGLTQKIMGIKICLITALGLIHYAFATRIIVLLRKFIADNNCGVTGQYICIHVIVSTLLYTCMVVVSMRSYNY